MRVINVLKTALKALAKNKMRSFLTALGIIIGVGAVLSMISMGTAATIMVEEQIATLGRDVLMVFPGSISRGGRRHGFGSRTTLTPEDAEAIHKQCPSVSAASGVVRSAGQLVYGNMNWATSVYGVSEEYFDIRLLKVSSGKMFTNADVRGSKKVAVIGTEVSKNLIGQGDPVGKIIRINKIPFTVVGLLEERGQAAMGSSQDDIVYIPLTTAQKRIAGITHVNMIFVSAVNSELMETAKSEIEELLRARHKIRPGKEDDFHVRNSADIVETSSNIMTALTMLLGAIASVSLIVGGIGIMNIMLVSVVERTREIGVRMAVGARERDILRQFLIEAVVLSGLGGVLGVILGIGISLIIADIADWEPYISVVWGFIAFLFSAGVGIFFGFYPAYKASKLDPIEALRYE